MDYFSPDPQPESSPVETRDPKAPDTATHAAPQEDAGGQESSSDDESTSKTARRFPSILFTAFEPSGDAHAAPVIARLLSRHPELRIYAWGGPKMAEAGAQLVEQTCDNAAMGLGALKKIGSHRQLLGRIKRWSKQYRVLAHIPVDSPAANFPICKIMLNHGARVVHLVAPQLWAWGRWRLRKLRKRTSMVLCLLPFEEQWFSTRNIPAKFIGHPVMNEEYDTLEIREQMRGLPQGAPRLAIFPGSRPHEVHANLRLLIDIYTELQGRHAGMGGVIVAASADIAKIIRKKIHVFPTGLHMVTGMMLPAIGWSDLCIAVSGTISLQITRQCKPMIGVYKTGLGSWLLSKLLLRTPLRLLPNIVAEREIVPEFIPHVGGPGPIVKQATKYFADSKNAAVQAEELRRVCLRFSNHDPAREAANAIVRVIKSGSAKQ